MHVSYDKVLKASENSEPQAFDFKYVAVALAPGDTMDNPASTKHNVGPFSHESIWLWEIHASGIRLREYDSIKNISPELGAATICACCGRGL